MAIRCFSLANPIETWPLPSNFQLSVQESQEIIVFTSIQIAFDELGGLESLQYIPYVGW